METWFQTASVPLIIGVVCMLWIVVDLFAGHPQKMMIMNFVYPITALYAGPLALWIYYVIGRRKASPGSKPNPFWQSALISTLHCGSGCTLGDILAETMLLYFPVVLLGNKLLGTWTVDYVFAFAIGILFQYFSIKPMRNLSPGAALKVALKADWLSLSFWQIGMYGWMAIAIFILYKHPLDPRGPLFWCMMQVGMLCGLVTAYPINVWLLKKGIKEGMD